MTSRKLIDENASILKRMIEEERGFPSEMIGGARRGLVPIYTGGAIVPLSGGRRKKQKPKKKKKSKVGSYAKLPVGYHASMGGRKKSAPSPYNRFVKQHMPGLVRSGYEPQEAMKIIGAEWNRAKMSKGGYIYA